MYFYVLFITHLANHKCFNLRARMMMQ